MTQKFDVDVKHHNPWDSDQATKIVKKIIETSKTLYGKLLENVEPHDREPTVRERLLFEDEEMRKFSVVHPRLFGLASSESIIKDPKKKQNVFMLLYIHKLVATGQVDKQEAHDKFVQLTMEVSKK